MLDVQGLIWLLAPTQDTTVSSPVAIEGYGTAFEATITWEVRKDGQSWRTASPKVAPTASSTSLHDSVAAGRRL